MQLTNCHAKTYIEKFTYSLITVRKNDWKKKIILGDQKMN
jgi:hypothetical protein